MRRGIQSAIFLACVLFSVAGAYNVMADNADVEAMAQATACGDGKAACKAQKTFMERTPIAQTFEFATGTTGKRVSVRCARAFVLAGEYTCTAR
jgi:hypothetical protein